MDIAKVTDLLSYSGEVTNWNLMNNFQAVVDMEIEKEDQPLNWEKKVFLWLPTWDYAYNTKDSAPDLNWLSNAVTMVSSLVLHRYNTLVHCQHGENRSGMIVAGTLMKVNNLTADISIQMVQQGKQNAINNGTWRDLNYGKAVWNQTWVEKLHELQNLLGIK